LKSLKYNLNWIPTKIARFLYSSLKKDDSYFLKSLFEDQGHLIYVHMPKAGGNSIEKGLKLRKTGHKPLKLFEIALPEKDYNSAVIFTFVRDPWSRLASAYYYLKSGKGSVEDNLWVEKNLSEVDDFKSFVKCYVNGNSVYNYIHLIPQIEFLKQWNGVPKANFIGRLDNIEEDFLDLCKLINRPNLSLPHNNKTEKRFNYLDEYDEEMIEIVSMAYSEDISFFNFPLPKALL
jgi:hypothetical protein